MTQTAVNEEDNVDALNALVRELRESLEMERGKVETSEAKIRELQRHNVLMQAHVEQEEEYISNSLLKKIRRLKEDKEQLVMEVEREEEWLTNTLTVKMEQLKREKADLQESLSKEHNDIVERLNRKIRLLEATSSDLSQKVEQSRVEKIHLENFLEAEQEFLTNRLQRQMDQLILEKSRLEARLKTANHPDVMDLQTEVQQLTGKLERHKEMHMASVGTHFQNHEDMREENILLRRRVAYLTSRLSSEQTRKLKMTEELEIHEEKLFNNVAPHELLSPDTSRYVFRSQSFNEFDDLDKELKQRRSSLGPEYDTINDSRPLTPKRHVIPPPPTARRLLSESDAPRTSSTSIFDEGSVTTR